MTLSLYIVCWYQWGGSEEEDLLCVYHHVYGVWGVGVWGAFLQSERFCSTFIWIWIECWYLVIGLNWLSSKDSVFGLWNYPLFLLLTWANLWFNQIFIVSYAMKSATCKLHLPFTFSGSRINVFCAQLSSV